MSKCDVCLRSEGGVCPSCTPAEIARLRAELEAMKKERDKAHEVVESWGDCGYCNLPTCWQRSNSATCGGHTRAEWERYKGWPGCPEAASAIECDEARELDTCPVATTFGYSSRMLVFEVEGDPVCSVPKDLFDSVVRWGVSCGFGQEKKDDA